MMRSQRGCSGWTVLCVLVIANSQVACSPSGRRAPSFTDQEGKLQTPDNAGIDSADFVKIVALVPVRDEAHLLPSCLRSLRPLVHAIVVLDDCSTDGSGDVAREHAEECKVERVARSPNCSNGDLTLAYLCNVTLLRRFLESLSCGLLWCRDVTGCISLGAGASQDDAGGSNALPYWGNEAAHRGFLLVLIHQPLSMSRHLDPFAVDFASMVTIR